MGDEESRLRWILRYVHTWLSVERLGTDVRADYRMTWNSVLDHKDVNESARQGDGIKLTGYMLVMLTCKLLLVVPSISFIVTSWSLDIQTIQRFLVVFNRKGEEWHVQYPPVELFSFQGTRQPWGSNKTLTKYPSESRTSNSVWWSYLNLIPEYLWRWIGHNPFA